jgi:hypothetical protein
MTSFTNLAEQQFTEMENPLLWPILEILRKQNTGWKVHTLASRLSELDILPTLDISPDKDLFKRNFLIMNALYQLQETLSPDGWVQVQAMDIRLMGRVSHGGFAIDVEDPLRLYYTDWSNYEAEEGEVKRLLNEFWTRYRSFVGDVQGDINRTQALRLFELPAEATQKDIRKRWRKLALRWHPDRDNGNADKFRVLCKAWNILREKDFSTS